MRPRTQVAQHRAQRGQVEHVLQALARRLEQHRGSVGCFDATVEQVGGALALLPQRRALAGPAAGQQQRARRVLAEPRREQRRCSAASTTTSSSISSGSIDELVEREVVDRFGQPQHDAVVGPQHLDRQAEPLVEARSERERPRRVHLRAERREDADAPVADLVAEALDDDRAVVGHRAGGLGLLVEVPQEVVRGPAGRARVVRQAGHRVVARRGRGARARTRRAPGRARAAARAGRRARTASCPACPGAGVTTTRSNVMSSIRHVDAPRTNVSPARLS